MTLNISGQWDGTFAYPDVPEAGPITPFLANIQDIGGSITGTTIEPHEYREGTAQATLAGNRHGNSIHFTKTYHGAGFEYREAVIYIGTLCEEGDLITGEWSIEHWRGPFEMVRHSLAEPLVDDAVEATAW